jgi:hypothetical protein
VSGLVVESSADAIRGSVPVRFGMPGAPLQEVEAVLDWWPSEGHRYFRVRVGGGAEYILRQDLATSRWRLDVFQRDGGGGG